MVLLDSESAVNVEGTDDEIWGSLLFSGEHRELPLASGDRSNTN